MIPAAAPADACGFSVEEKGTKVGHEVVEDVVENVVGDVVEGVVVCPGTKAPGGITSASTSKHSICMRRCRTHAPHSNSPTLQLLRSSGDVP